jgi:hypothetical protein
MLSSCFMYFFADSHGEQKSINKQFIITIIQG